MKLTPLHFLDQPIEVQFSIQPDLEKSPHCPDQITWDDATYRVVEMLAEWKDFSRHGRMARNMRPSHAGVAAGRGSLGVGRFHFQVRVEGGRIFEIYYDRQIISAGDRKGRWFVYRELAQVEESMGDHDDQRDPG